MACPGSTAITRKSRWGTIGSPWWRTPAKRLVYPNVSVTGSVGLRAPARRDSRLYVIDVCAGCGRSRFFGVTRGPRQSRGSGCTEGGDRRPGVSAPGGRRTPRFTTGSLTPCHIAAAVQTRYRGSQDPQGERSTVDGWPGSAHRSTRRDRASDAFPRVHRTPRAGFEPGGGDRHLLGVKGRPRAARPALCLPRGCARHPRRRSPGQVGSRQARRSRWTWGRVSVGVLDLPQPYP